MPKLLGGKKEKRQPSEGNYLLTLGGLKGEGDLRNKVRHNP